MPILELWNKWDLLDDERRAELEPLAAADADVLPLSAVTGFGVERLLERLGEVLTKGARRHSITLPASDGQRIAWLHSHGEVLDEEEVQTLVSESYLRSMPRDPFTTSSDTWQTVPAEPESGSTTAAAGIFDVKSGSEGTGIDGSRHADW